MYKRQIHEHPIKTVRIANDEEMIIAGAAKIPLRAGKRTVNSEILITPDLTGFIIGVDWLEKQGRFEWNFRNGQIKFEDEEWLDLQPEETSRRVCRVIVSRDTVIPPTAQTNVVRIKHRTAKDKPYLGFVENGEVPSLKQAVSYTHLTLPTKRIV